MSCFVLPSPGYSSGEDVVLCTQVQVSTFRDMAAWVKTSLLYLNNVTLEHFTWIHTHTYTLQHKTTNKELHTERVTLWCIWVMSQRAVEAPFTRLAVPPRDHYHNNFHTTPHLRPVDATLQSLSTTMTLPHEIGRLLWVDDFQLMAELTWRSVK